jgi:hypothetical protein
MTLVLPEGVHPRHIMDALRTARDTNRHDSAIYWSRIMRKAFAKQADRLDAVLEAN